MKKICFNKDWRFTFENHLDSYNHFGLNKYGEGSGAASRFLDNNNWQRIDVPHDYVLGLPKLLHGNAFKGGRPAGGYAWSFSEMKLECDELFNVGWYRKDFFIDASYSDKRVFIEFEGVFRDSIVFVNGEYIDRHSSGYTSFMYDITEHLYIGEFNSIAVRVDCECSEGWWYEGGGIYRNVNLCVSPNVHFKYNKTFVKALQGGEVNVSTVIVNQSQDSIQDDLLAVICDKNGAEVASSTVKIQLSPFSEGAFDISLKVESPRHWDINDPYLYTLKLICIDQEEIRIGFRSVKFDPDVGCLLNGKRVKLRGACVHQDFGGVGIALTRNLHFYKINLLKEMGVNAYRCSHNPPAPDLLDACDELGMLVLDETRAFGSSPEALRQQTDLVERDRNHPSVIMWSIGNEEMAVQNHPNTYTLAKTQIRELLKLDDTRPITYAGNNGASSTGINRAVKVKGINYVHNDKEGWIEEFHKNNPDIVIIGTEETSHFASRGATKTDLGSSVIDYTGDAATHWGQTPEGFVRFYESRPYLAGGFMWTGFDYRGEPTPFTFTNLSSFFGTIDLCGIPKAPFYYYKSCWCDEPIIKMAPHWCYNEGEIAHLRIYTNLDEVTVYLNERNLGVFKNEKFGFIKLDVPFEKGTISCIGSKNGRLYRDSMTTAEKTHDIKIVKILDGNENGIGIFELRAVDAFGNFNPLASERLSVSVSDGYIVGVGNGDPSDLDPEVPSITEDARYLRTLDKEGNIYFIPPKAKNTRFSKKSWGYREEPTYYGDKERYVVAYDFAKRDKEGFEYKVNFSDAEKYEYIEFERFGCDATVFLNGELIGDNINGVYPKSNSNNRPFRFYCSFKNGNNELIIKTRNESTELYPPISGYLKLGKEIREDARVRLHYGTARIFTKHADESIVSVKIVI